MHTEPFSKITVALLRRQIAALDHLSVNIRLNTQKALGRAALIRAFIDAAERRRLSTDEVLSIVRKH